jgi:hypothetical protein
LTSFILVAAMLVGCKTGYPHVLKSKSGLKNFQTRFALDQSNATLLASSYVQDLETLSRGSIPGPPMVSMNCNRVATRVPSMAVVRRSCRNPNLAKCGGEAQHLEKLGIWSPPGLPNVQSSTEGLKTPRIGVFLVSLERS